MFEDPIKETENLDTTPDDGNVTREEEEELFNKYLSTKSPESVEMILQRYDWVVGTVIKRANTRYNFSQDEIQDVTQIIKKLLSFSIGKFKPELGNRFSTYAFHVIYSRLGKEFQKLRGKVLSIGWDDVNPGETTFDPPDPNSVNWVNGILDQEFIDSLTKILTEEECELLFRFHAAYGRTKATLKELAREQKVSKQRIQQKINAIYLKIRKALNE